MFRLQNNLRWSVLYIALLPVSFGLVHTWLFVYYRSPLVLGFDTGFYRRYLLEPLNAIPHASVPGLDHTVIIPRVILDLVRLLGFSTDVTLYGTYIFIAALLVGSFWWYVRDLFNTATATWSVFLVLFSGVYFHGYWYFLLKNFLALALMWWLFLAVRHRWYLALVLLALCLPITHQSTTVIAGTVLFLWAGINWRRVQNLWPPLLAWALLFSLYLFYHPTVAAKLSAPPSAIFLQWSEFCKLGWPLLLLAAAGLYGHWRALVTKPDLIAFVTVCVVFLVGSLPYYERVFLFVVFPLAIFGSLYLVTEQRLWVKVGILCGVFLWWGISVSSYQPYFTSDQVTSFVTLSELPSSAQVLTANYLAPWVHGYTTAAVYAPGVFKDSYSPYAWQLYWSHTDPSFEYAFLDSYPQPMYFYLVPGLEYFLPTDPACSEPVADGLYRYTCYNNAYDSTAPFTP